jgi:hypothetical protein
MFKEIEWKGADWIALAKDKEKWQVFVDMLMRLWGFIKFG